MPCSLRVSWTLLAATPVAASLYTQPCPLYGQNYPAPTGLATSKHVEAAAESVLDQLLKAKNGTTSYGPLDTDTTAFSVDFYSLESEGTLFSHHYTPAQLLGQRTVGVEEVDSDTIYRVGSVSKLWTVYLYLIAAGEQSWNEPITKFIPELHELVQGQEPDPTSDVDWQSITVGALASHLAGIGRDPTHVAALAKVFGDLGIPSQSDSSSSSCGDPALVTLPCNRSRGCLSVKAQPSLASHFSNNGSQTQNSSQTFRHSTPSSPRTRHRCTPTPPSRS